MRKIIEFQYDDTIKLPELLKDAIRNHSSDALLGLSLGIQGMRELPYVQGRDTIAAIRKIANPGGRFSYLDLEKIRKLCDDELNRPYLDNDDIDKYCTYYLERGVKFNCPLCRNDAEIVDMEQFTSEFGIIIDVHLECATCPHHLSSTVSLPYPLEG